MNSGVTRRQLSVGLGGVLVAQSSLAAEAQNPGEAGQAKEPERDYPAPKFTPSFKKPKLGNTLLYDFVLFAHYEFDLVKRLYEKEPALLNGTVDWGGGDWESALGGAAHMGRRDIAEFLLEKGARMDLFAAAMLGHLDVVKAALTARPGLLQAKGPHGIPLRVHAKAGGEPAAKVLEYLDTLAPAPTKT